MAKESPEEGYVRELFNRRFGIQLRKIPESTEPTPDFELLDEVGRVAVLEVKTLERAARTEENGWRRVEGGGLTRNDNAPGRVGTCIAKAWRQLASHPEPKVLVFVNDETGIDVHDLEAAFHGTLPFGNEELGYADVPIAMPAAMTGRIKDVKRKIDLYIWLDRKYGEGRLVQVFPTGQPPFTETRTEGPTFRCVTDAGYELARRYFGCPEMPRPDASKADEDAAPDGK
jgi:hypothetical protein